MAVGQLYAWMLATLKGKQGASCCVPLGRMGMMICSPLRMWLQRVRQGHIRSGF